MMKIRIIRAWCNLGVSLPVSPETLRRDPREAILTAAHQGTLKIVGVTEVPVGKEGMLHHPLLRRPDLPRPGVLQVYFLDSEDLYLRLAAKGEGLDATLV